MLLVGKTGSGKTFAARRLLEQYPAVLAIDPKCTLGGPRGLPGYRLVRDHRRLTGMRDPHVQLRLEPGQQNPAVWSAVYWWAFRRGNTFIYTDEMYLVLQNNRATVGLRACITSGRERGIGMLHAAQRPAGIPVMVRSECERFAVWELPHEEDRMSMRGIVPDDRVLTVPPHQYAFWFYDNPQRRFTYAVMEDESDA